MPPDGISCREFVDFLSDYLEGELRDEVRESFEAHLALCPDCVAYLASFRETVRLGREYGPADEPPADAPPELVAAVLEARRRARG